jgi:hypothetical protein
VLQHCGAAGQLPLLFTVDDFLEMRLMQHFCSNVADKMANVANICQKLQNGLDPYVKAREQVNYIRRILAVQLAQCTQDGSARPPLALAASSDEPEPNEKRLDGLYKEYLDELRKNHIARRGFDAIRRDALETAPHETGVSTPTSSPLEERIALLKLHRKRDGLYAIQETLDTLLEKGSASTRFFDSDRMFQSTPPLPSVPKDVINTMVIEQSSSTPDITSQVNQLEKIVLRAKLLLRQEEQLLREAKSQSHRISQPVHAAAKLDALSVTRDELINWIETELGKASSPGKEDEDQHNSDIGKDSDPATIAALLDEIREKYARYTTARKTLLCFIAQSKQEMLQPPSNATEIPKKQFVGTASEDTKDCLVTPYMGQLLAVSRNQKSTMTQKAHTVNILSKQSKESVQKMDQLAEESQLLQDFPMEDSQRRHSGIRDNVHSAPDLAARIKPWVFAADSAKIATLEAVAENVERGQMALEGLWKTLTSLDELTWQEAVEDTTATGDDPTEEDVWIPSPQKTPGRKHTGRNTKDKDSGDIWSKLDGKLGLLGQDGP